MRTLWGLRRTRTSGVVLTAALIILAGCTAAGTTARRSATATPTGAAGRTPTVTATSASTGSPTGLASWTEVKSKPGGTLDVRIAPSQAQTAYLCADDGPAAAPIAQTSRLYKSLDGAQSWQVVAGAPTLHPVPAAVSGPAPLAGCRVFVDAQDANDVFFQQTEIEPVGASFAIARALYRSRDGGTTWQQLTAMPNTDGFDALAVVGARLVARPHPSVLGVAACDPTKIPTPVSFVYASDDGGMTWHDLGQAIEGLGYSPGGFAALGSTVVASADQVPPNACAPSPGSGLWRSTDGGTTWARTSAPAAYVGPLSLTSKTGGLGVYGLAWASPAQPSGDVGPLYSLDGGASWTALPTRGLSGSPYGSGEMVVTPSGTVLLNGGQGDKTYALHLSDESPQWTPYAAGTPGSWQLVSGPAGTTLWSIFFQLGGSSSLEYLKVQ